MRMMIRPPSWDSTSGLGASSAMASMVGKGSTTWGRDLGASLDRKGEPDRSNSTLPLRLSRWGTGRSSAVGTASRAQIRKRMGQQADNRRAVSATTAAVARCRGSSPVMAASRVRMPLLVAGSWGSSRSTA